MSEMTCECGRTGAHTCNGLGEKGYQSIDPDSAEERVLRYAQLIHEACGCDGCPVHPEDVAGARAAIAVADEEQARLKWLVRHHADIYAGACEDASRAEAEVERLTRECLDREATETDARERLRRVEAAVLERAANDWTAGEWAMAFRQGGPLTKAQDVADWLRARARATND